MSPTMFAELCPPYGTIVVDPPWRYSGAGRMLTTANKPWTNPDPNVRYSGLTIGELSALPVAELASKHAHLYMWVTNPILPDAWPIIGRWGFTYRTFLTWRKLGTLGLGSWFRGDTEHVIFATRGSAKIAPSNRHRNWFEAPKRGHSVKPAEFMDMVERVSPGPYVELFARQPRLGWDSWGFGYE